MIYEADNLLLHAYRVLKIDTSFKKKFFKFFHPNEKRLGERALNFWSILNAYPPSAHQLTLIYFKLNDYWFHSPLENKVRANSVRDFLRDNFSIDSMLDDEFDVYLLINDQINKLREALDDLNATYNSTLIS